MRQELDTMASAVSMAANFTFPAVLVNDLSRSFVTSSLMLDAGCGQIDFEREHDSRCWDFETLLADKHRSLLGHVGAESCCYKALETLHRHGPWRLLDITQEAGTLTHPLGTEQVVSILVAASLSEEPFEAPWSLHVKLHQASFAAAFTLVDTRCTVNKASSI